MCIAAVQRTLNQPILKKAAVVGGFAAVAYAGVPVALAAGTMYGLSICLSRKRSSTVSAAEHRPAAPLLGPAGVIASAKKLGTPCDEAQLQKTKMIMEIHDKIEETAYRSFANIVERLGIRGDAITEEQSGIILAHIKSEAHIEMYKKGGYTAERGNLLDKQQFQYLASQVGKIIHDRDTKLTDARYHSLSSMLLALDDHNSEVKDILIKSWFRCPVADPTHLDQVKDRVDFNSRMNGALGFDLSRAVQEKTALLDRSFPGLRAASAPGEADRSAEFVRILAVRDLVGGINFREMDLSAPLESCVPADVSARLFTQREVRNVVRGREVQTRALIDDSRITLGQFLAEYFPETK
jgi:hypothetical protein